jgi:hypothetical protein
MLDVMKQALAALEDYEPQEAHKVVIALRAAITDYAQTSFDVCGQCGWRTQRPGFECLNCLNADLQAKLNKYMAQEAARESKK